MGDKTGIEWTDATWNPIAGCSVVSPGCTNCYAMKVAHRLGTMPAMQKKYGGLTKMTKGGPVWTGEVRFDQTALDQPLRWKRPRRIFVNSMSDLFHESVPGEWIDRVFAVMAMARQHTFQVLTKRPQRMHDYIAAVIYNEPCRINEHILDLGGDPDVWSPPLANVWLGVSVEDQRRADERIPLLIETPAALRFLSCEPLIRPVDLSNFIFPDPIRGGFNCSGKYRMRTPPLDWVIVGGESGSGARPMHPDWARQIRDDCQAAGVAFHFKQFGEWTPGENVQRHTGIVDTATWFANKWMFGREDLANEGGHFEDQPDIYRLGKKAAGRTLDGRTWDEYPTTIKEAA